MTADQVIAQLTTLQATVEALQAGAASPALGFAKSTDGKSLLVQQGGVTVQTITLPTWFNWRNTWITATAFAPGDAFYSNGSSYYTLLQHNSTTIAADLAAGKITPIALKGAPGFNFTGTFNVTRQYYIGDAVQLLDGTLNVYVAVYPPPVGTAPAAGSAYWGLAIAALPLSSHWIKDTGRNDYLDSIIADIYAQLASMNGIINSINNKLHTAGITGF
jgi:hypothetical protein